MHHPGSTMRHEDHVGHKIDYVDDVQLLDSGGNPLGISCDYLFKIHQGTHSPDALANNVHELAYVVRCSDGAALVSTTMVPFGAPNEFNRSCAPSTVQPVGTALVYPSGPGSRLIPDRACVEQHILVAGNRGSAFWSVYENWRSQVALAAADGTQLAFYDPDFAVFNPSRYASSDGTQTVRHMVEACWEVDAAGESANREPCTAATGGGTIGAYPFDDPRSPFDGAKREFYLGQTAIANAAGPTLWYTDPYGANGSATPFHGAVRQYVAQVDSTGLAPLQRRLFGRGVDYGESVHSPN